jgi:hypothetical protein
MSWIAWPKPIFLSIIFVVSMLLLFHIVKVGGNVFEEN